MDEVTVVIPVGPNPSNKKWLKECLDSVLAQTVQPNEILIIDDQANLKHSDIGDYGHESYWESSWFETVFIWPDHPDLRIWRTPWLSGIPHAFNFGIALARNELVIMLGSDDWLEPEAVEKLIETYNRNSRRDGYYGFTIRYSDNGELQDLPNNCAGVTKGLWNLTGGFPPESEIGACDSIFISMLMANHPHVFWPVALGYPLYNYRRHNDSDTGTRSVAYQGPISVVRDIFTREWKKPTWTPQRIS